MKKIKWKNVIKAYLLILSLILIIHDVIMILFLNYSWTWLGLITFMLATGIAISIYDDFYEQIKNQCLEH